jgi:GH35 family endo-1,4-beta-xylanase
MKNLYKLALGVTISVAMASCTKHELLDFHVDKPASFENQEIIDAYQHLKTYLNKEANPNFKFGAAVSLSDYVNKGVMYRLVNNNFDEIVLGYAMKHGAVVKADGKLDLDNVKELLKTAHDAGMSVYGHTLCWHANQNAAYLKKLIAPIIIPGTAQPTWDLVTGANFESDNNSNYEANSNAQLSFTAVGQGAGGQGRALKITNDAVRTNDWDAQFFIKFSPAVKAGEKYEFSMDVKADANVTFSTQAHTVPYSYKFYDFFGAISATPTWTKYTKVITVSDNEATSGAIAFNLGKNATNYYFDNITLKKYNEKGSGNAGHAYFFTNPTAKPNYWEAQVAYGLPVLQNNKEYTLKFVAKGSVAGNIRVELQSPDYSSDGFGSFGLTTGWKQYELKATTTKADRKTLLYSFADYEGTVYIDNVELTASGDATNLVTASDFENGSTGWGGWGNNSTRGVTAQGEGYGGAQDQIIEKTPAEKKTIITAELDRFISGMVDTCKAYVNAWDVVNEPMDDGNPNNLKSGVGKTLKTDEFYWQDYMGKDYAVEAFKLAKQHVKAGDLLFINDYNLEYNLDKCRGLIDYVAYIEGKGAVVDGIGTQMHISTTSDKQKIADMFTLLAATGKKIKVSELDMGIDGKKTAEATAADYQAQADMYKYVIDKYFEIIPAKQRYGITIWSPLDSPDNSSWRAGEPIGLWTGGFTRKPAYVGVAEALKGK